MKVCLLDRDGVINLDVGYLRTRDEIVIAPTVSKAFSHLDAFGYKIFVFTNQSGVARGLMSFKRVHEINNAISEKIYASSGVRISGFKVCPHYEFGTVSRWAVKCDCRKPNVGMIRAIWEESRFECSEAIVIGDKPSDIEAGFNFGIRKMALIESVYHDHTCDYFDRHWNIKVVVRDNLYNAVLGLAG